VITDLGAVDEDLGILKTGKEADIHVIRRWVRTNTWRTTAETLSITLCTWPRNGSATPTTGCSTGTDESDAAARPAPWDDAPTSASS